MKEKIQAFVRRFKSAVKQNPVETLLAVLFSLCACNRGNITWSVAGMLLYFPVSFLLAYTLNCVTEKRKIRWLYYLSAFSFVPLLWAKDDFSCFYAVSIGVSVLLYWICDWRKDNENFVRHGLKFVNSVFFSCILAGVGYLLAVSIYYSIKYIFDIWQEAEWTFLNNASSLSFFLLWPLLFLVFNGRQRTKATEGRVFGILLNYLLTPALLIYTAILYLYFVKIALLWSLPKGGVALIVAVFVLALFVLNGLQPLLRKRYYDWFYSKASWFAIPALIVFWIGVSYRVRQYGFTEDRVYLLVTGTLMTYCTGLFFFKRLGKYVYVATGSIVLLALFTYIPPISGKAIGIYSQTERLDRAAHQLHLPGHDGKWMRGVYVQGDTAMAKTFRQLYSSFDYLAQVKGSDYMWKKYGINSLYQLYQNIIPAELTYYVKNGYFEEEARVDYFTLDFSEEYPIQLAGFRELYQLKGYKREGYYATCERDTLYIKNDNPAMQNQSSTVLFARNMNDLFDEQLRKLNYPSQDTLSMSWLKQHQRQLLIYDTDSLRLVLENISLDWKALRKVHRIEVSCLLKR